MTCSIQECDKPNFAKGMCAAHYSRVRRHGGVERIRMAQEGNCSHLCCDMPALSKGLCRRHYQQNRPELNTIWKLLRSRAKGSFPAEWMDYDRFCADVGERPSPQHQLRRVDRSRPWSADNFVWLEPIGVSSVENGPHYQWVWNLRNAYGLSPEDVELIIAHQRGLCPACNQPLGYFGPTSRKDATVVVEHDHIAGDMPPHHAVRGIMHRTCNSGMGLLGDDAAILRRAADHLEAHQHRKALNLSLIHEITNGGK